eukprot:86475-Prymnesium_polylepis.1
MPGGASVEGSAGAATHTHSAAAAAHGMAAPPAPAAARARTPAAVAHGGEDGLEGGLVVRVQHAVRED